MYIHAYINTCTGLYGLGDGSVDATEAKQRALAAPNDYVLKPQREVCSTALFLCCCYYYQSSSSLERERERERKRNHTGSNNLNDDDDKMLCYNALFF